MKDTVEKNFVLQHQSERTTSNVWKRDEAWSN